MKRLKFQEKKSGTHIYSKPTSFSFTESTEETLQNLVPQMESFGIPIPDKYRSMDRRLSIAELDLDNHYTAGLESLVVNLKKTIEEGDVIHITENPEIIKFNIDKKMMDKVSGIDLIDAEDEALLEETKSLRRIVVLNKSDLNSETEIDGILISAGTNDIQNLINKIKEVVGLDDKAFKTPALNNTRQIGLLQKAKEDLIKAKQDAESGLTIDLISVSIMDAYTSVLEILGEANQIDLAKEIFSRFCVGK